MHAQGQRAAGEQFPHRSLLGSVRAPLRTARQVAIRPCGRARVNAQALAHRSGRSRPGDRIAVLAGIFPNPGRRRANGNVRREQHPVRARAVGGDPRGRHRGRVRAGARGGVEAPRGRRAGADQRGAAELLRRVPGRAGAARGRAVLLPRARGPGACLGQLPAARPGPHLRVPDPLGLRLRGRAPGARLRPTPRAPRRSRRSASASFDAAACTSGGRRCVARCRTCGSAAGRRRCAGSRRSAADPAARYGSRTTAPTASSTAATRCESSSGSCPTSRRAGARTIVTVGALATNHGLATALYARARGIRCVVALVDQPVDDHVRRQLGPARALRRAPLLHARHVPHLPRGALDHAAPCRSAAPAAALLPDRGRLVAARLRRASSRPRSSWRAQVERGELPEPSHVVVALGSGGTAAGLVAGLRLAGLRTRVVAVVVNDRTPVGRGVGREARGPHPRPAPAARGAASGGRDRAGRPRRRAADGWARGTATAPRRPRKRVPRRPRARGWRWTRSTRQGPGGTARAARARRVRRGAGALLAQPRRPRALDGPSARWSRSGAAIRQRGPGVGASAWAGRGQAGRAAAGGRATASAGAARDARR